MKLLLVEKLLKQIYKKYCKLLLLKMRLLQENDNYLVILDKLFIKFNLINELFGFNNIKYKINQKYAYLGK